MSFRNFVTDMDPNDFCEFVDDFHGYTATDWVITTTEAGTGSATEVVQDESFGVLKLTNAAGDNDNDFLQLAKETVKFVAGKRLYFGARFKVLEAIQCDWVMGLQIRDTSPLAVTDGVWFGSDDGDALIDFHVAKDSTQTDVVDVGTMPADTYQTLELYYDGSTAGRIQIIVNGMRVGAAALTNMVDDEELTLSFGIQNGQAVVNTMSVDYIRAVVER
jgi:hypothetical protein